jgi:hypothetical protein
LLQIKLGVDENFAGEWNSCAKKPIARTRNSIRFVTGGNSARKDFVDWILEKVEVTSSAAHPARDRDETEQGKASGAFVMR